MADSASLWRRIVQRDPLLLARLFAGDARLEDLVVRMLRLTPLELLKRHPGALVDLLTACPDAQHVLRGSWESQDPRFTHQVVSWVRQQELRVSRAA